MAELRCRKGDLAYVTSCPGIPEIVGAVVVCRQLIYVDGLPMWRIEQPIELSDCFVTGLADMCLHPIRHPGDDAKDQMLRPLPGVPA